MVTSELNNQCEIGKYLKWMNKIMFTLNEAFMSETETRRDYIPGPSAELL